LLLFFKKEGLLFLKKKKQKDFIAINGKTWPTVMRCPQDWPAG
jgi:hypothetical protein